jgi:hypothetical protein
MLQFGAIDAISDQARYPRNVRTQQRIDAVEVYCDELMEAQVPFRKVVIPGDSNTYLVTPDDAFHRFGRDQAIRNTAEQVFKVTNHYPAMLYRRLDRERSDMLDEADRLDFWL